MAVRVGSFLACSILTMMYVSSALGAGGNAVLYSPALTPGTDNALFCTITNVSNSTVDITIEIYGYFQGNETDQLDDYDFEDIAPLEGVYREYTDGAAVTPHVCKFIVSGSNKSGLRALACISDPGNSPPYFCVPAS